MENKDPPPPYPGVAQPTIPIPPAPGTYQQFYSFQPTAPLNNTYGPTYGTSTTTTVIVPPEVIIIGACPACRVGILEDEYTCLGVMCAILFFPLGILCCLADKSRRCSNCGASFD